MTIRGILRQFIKTRYLPWRLDSIKHSHRGRGGGGGGGVFHKTNFIKQMKWRCCLVIQFQEIVCYSALGIFIHDIVNCSM